MARAQEQGRIEILNASNTEGDEERARVAEHSESRRLTILIIVSIFVCVLAWILPTGMFYTFSQDMTLSVFVDSVVKNFGGLVGVFTGNGAAFESRFMVVLICAVSGAALGMCGSAYQGAFNNPLAAPKTLGVMAGGALGALIYVIFLRNLGPSYPGSIMGHSYQEIMAWQATLNPLEWLWTNYSMCLCSIAGCLIVVALVIFLTSVLNRGKLSNIIVIIFGQILAASVTALIAFARYWFTQNNDLDTADALKAIENYTMVNDYGFIDLLIVVLPIVICIVIVLLMSRRMTLLSFGDDVAATMGINVNASRYAMIIVCTIMVAWSISFCGHVAFLGFISAHLARRIVGPNFKYLLPASLCTGCTLLTFIQYICQSGLPGTYQNAAGSVCSVVGSVLFIIMVILQWRKGTAGEWR